MSGKRVIIIVLDSVGVGYMEDAGEFGDTGANTLGNTAASVGGLKLPNLGRLGIGNIIKIEGVPPAERPEAKYGRMREASKGKDTMTGHWEMMGIISEEPFPLFPGGFPGEIVDEFLERAGMDGILGNVPASGTEIIKKLGVEHILTGFPIIYTSGDSVFQVAAHTDVIPLSELYRICGISRKICDKYRIGRVIARPFSGTPGKFERTADRRDYPMIPPGETVLDVIRRDGLPVAGIGKIEDIYAGRGISRAVHTHNNREGMDALMRELSVTGEGLIFVNLVDFDMLHGHRRNPEAYGAALEDFDRMLGELIPSLLHEDLLIITADHGCDPTFRGTDHTREFVPLLASGHGITPGNMGTRETFADMGVTVLQYLGLKDPGFPGTVFL